MRRPELCWFACLLMASCEKTVPQEIVNPAMPAAPVPGGGNDPGGDGEDPGSLDSGPAASMDASANPEPPTEKFSKAALLKAVAKCSVGQYETFAQHAEGLRDATRAWSSELSDETKKKARSAWRSANSSWQRAELFRFGPAARAMDDPGGKELRDLIYAFPQGNPCLVDQRIVDEKYATAFETLLIGARGLNALEYLLFYDAASNACAPGISINARGTWEALGTEEIERRRAAYAAAAAADILAHTRELTDAWAGAGGNFAKQLSDTGNGKVYGSDQVALNAVSHGLFYLEKEIKDWKLGLPLGLTDGCAMTTCPSAVEAPFAKVSKNNLRENLAGFRSLFQGCGTDNGGLGFDDWLIAVGAQDLAERMLSALAGAEQAVADLDLPVEEAIVTAPEKLQTVHAAVKKLNDLLKTEFVTTLNLELPMGAEGDND